MLDIAHSLRIRLTINVGAGEEHVAGGHMVHRVASMLLRGVAY